MTTAFKIVGFAPAKAETTVRPFPMPQTFGTMAEAQAAAVEMSKADEVWDVFYVAMPATVELEVRQ